ncbi:oleate hydratase [Hominifimenecus sp. rT4P-3]|uniref:oleate hydratase n=1 Tax=Hominifimenecus sp. rT4P-3 TaxID=3242979 RepID=UPI003DA5CF55
MKKRHWKKVLVAGGAVAAAAIVKKSYEAKTRRQHQKEVEEQLKKRRYGKRQAYLLGDGLTGLAAAVYLIRDARFPANQIHIFSGGSNTVETFSQDGSFPCWRSRFLEEKLYENFWELLESFSVSKKHAKISMAEDIRRFSKTHPVCGKARMIDGKGRIVDTESLGLNQEERRKLAQLMTAGEDELEGQTIQDWFACLHFFSTNFWHLWRSAFDIREECGILEFRRLLLRWLPHFGDMDTMEWMCQFPIAPEDGVYQRLRSYLSERGVIFEEKREIQEIELEENRVCVTGIFVREEERSYRIPIATDDICLVTDGDERRWFSRGNWERPANCLLDKGPEEASFWALAASKRPGVLGRPEVFFENVPFTETMDFSIVCRGDTLLRKIEAFSGNRPGSGGLVTLRDSSWGISFFVPVQPYYKHQQPEETVLIGYGQYPERLGKYVQKPMKDCTGREIVDEVLSCLRWQEIWEKVQEEVIGCTLTRKPYARAAFSPHGMADRVSILPDPEGNLAFAGWFSDLPEETAGSEECQVRAARTAVYGLLRVEKEVLPVTLYRKDAKILAKALYAIYQ